MHFVILLLAFGTITLGFPVKSQTRVGKKRRNEEEEEEGRDLSD